MTDTPRPEIDSKQSRAGISYGDAPITDANLSVGDHDLILARPSELTPGNVTINGYSLGPDIVRRFLVYLTKMCDQAESRTRGD